MSKIDLFVIGAGSGGVRAARMAARMGKKVVIAESKDFGGTCVNLGCVPKKLFVYASHFSEEYEQAQGFGWGAASPDFDWQTLLENKNAEIKRLNGIYKGLLDNAGVTHYDGRARIVDAHHIEVIGIDKSGPTPRSWIKGLPHPFLPILRHVKAPYK